MLNEVVDIIRFIVKKGMGFGQSRASRRQTIGYRQDYWTNVERIERRRETGIYRRV